jgi:tetratricopeptide (TPR) repeat protein
MEKAEHCFRDALALDPRNVQALRGLAEILLEREELPEALGLLEALRHEDPTDLSLLQRIQGIREEVNELVTGRPPPGVSSTAILWEDPEGVEDEVDLDSARLQADRPRSGTREIEEVEGEPPQASGVVEDGEPIPEEEDPHTALITPTLGEIYVRQGLFGQAEQVFQALLEENPENDFFRRRLEEVRELRRGGDSEGLRERAHGRTEPEPLPASARPSEEERPSTGPLDSPEAASDSSTDPWGASELIEIVPIELLAPDRRRRPVAPDEAISVADLAPDEPLSVADLAPDEAVPVADLAPDEAVSVADLAPDEPLSVADLAPDEAVPVADLAPDEAIPVADLAPDEAVSVADLAPDEAVSVADLAPDDPVSIQDLAPGDPHAQASGGNS